MTRDIDYMVSVMQAHSEGKAIEWKSISASDACWEVDAKPYWDWLNFDYRVKPEPKYRPYKDDKEFLKGLKEHGLYMTWKEGGFMFIPHIVKKDGINFSAGGTLYPWKDVVILHCWQDGSPCGVLEE